MLHESVRKLRGSDARARMPGPPTPVSCPRVQDVVNTHPGLAFLKEASEFHSRYITTVSMAAAAREASWAPWDQARPD